MRSKRSLIKRIGDAVDHWIIQGGNGGRGSLDTMVEVVTPENISFDYRIAGPFHRFLAFALDVIFFFFLFFCVSLLTTLLFTFLLQPLFDAMGAPEISEALQSISSFLTLVAFFFGYWFYGAVFETYMNGQTPAKRMLSLRVLTIDGRPINGLQATVRTLLRYAEGLPFVSMQVVINWLPYLHDEFDVTPADLWPVPILSTFLAGLIAMTLTSRFQRIGDLFCGTMVVYETQHWFRGIERVDDVRAPKLAELIPPTFVASREMAGALATYVERRRYFSPERRREIARHLAEPLIADFGMLADTSYDLLLCAIYFRTFDQSDDESSHSDGSGGQQQGLGVSNDNHRALTEAGAASGDVSTTRIP